MANKLKNTGSFLILPKGSGVYLPENVQQLILIAKRNKARDLSSKLFQSNIYLPISLQIEQLKNEILKTNNELFLLSESNNFGRKIFEPEKYENDSFYNCFAILNENEYLQYLNYSASETDLKTLPKFNLITDYLALIDYFDDLRFDFNEVENGRKMPNPETRYQLQTKLNDTQRGKLFELLLSNKYIAPTTDKASFIWAFGGKQPQPSNWQPIEWIDESEKRHETNSKTLYELLYLLRVDKDTSAKNKYNLYRKMEFCFSGIEKNLINKNTHTTEQNTPRKKLLKTFIEEIKKVEAQK